MLLSPASSCYPSTDLSRVNSAFQQVGGTHLLLGEMGGSEEGITDCFYCYHCILENIFTQECLVLSLCVCEFLQGVTHLTDSHISMTAG